MPKKVEDLKSKRIILKPNGFEKNQMEAKKPDDEDEDDNEDDNDLKEKSKRKTFTPPTLEEIQKYVLEKQLKVDAKQFYNYFSEGKWIDSKGNKVKNWKQKILTWDNYTTPQKQNNKSKSYEQREYDNLNQFFVN